MFNYCEFLCFQTNIRVKQIPMSHNSGKVRASSRLQDAMFSFFTNCLVIDVLIVEVGHLIMEREVSIAIELF